MAILERGHRAVVGVSLATLTGVVTSRRECGRKREPRVCKRDDYNPGWLSAEAERDINGQEETKGGGMTARGGVTGLLGSGTQGNGLEKSGVGSETEIVEGLFRMTKSEGGQGSWWLRSGEGQVVGEEKATDPTGQELEGSLVWMVKSPRTEAGVCGRKCQ